MVIGSGLFFKLFETAAPVNVVFQRGGSTKSAMQVQSGYQYGPVPEDKRWDRVVITSATTQTVAALVGDEYEDYTRVVGTVQVQQTQNLFDYADANVTTTAAVVIAANGVRGRAVVKAKFDNTDDVRVGGSTVAAGRGIRLQPGQSYMTESQGDVWAIAISGTQVVELLEEAG